MNLKDRIKGKEDKLNRLAKAGKCPYCKEKGFVDIGAQGYVGVGKGSMLYIKKCLLCGEVTKTTA